MTPIALNRRALLGGAAAGISLAFAGRVSALSPAARPKLVVLIARGAMDGLSVTPPYGDAAYVPLRGGLAVPPPGQPDGALPLGDGFGLHPALTGLHDLYGQGQLRFAPAVALPVRIRSHFEAQDVLENGAATLRRQEDGWLNRAIVAAGGQPLKGLSIGAQTPLILRGNAAVSSWSPGGQVRPDDRLALRLQDLYADDPLLGPNLIRGLATEAQAEASGDGSVRRNDARVVQHQRLDAHRFRGAEGEVDAFAVRARAGAVHAQALSVGQATFQEVTIWISGAGRVMAVP